MQHFEQKAKKIVFLSNTTSGSYSERWSMEKCSRLLAQSITTSWTDISLSNIRQFFMIVFWKKCITWMHCKSLWIKASAKCINGNGNGICCLLYVVYCCYLWVHSFLHLRHLCFWSVHSGLIQVMYNSIPECITGKILCLEEKRCLINKQGKSWQLYIKRC